MKIGVVGAGKIGGTIGAKWAAAGHELCFGVRNPESEELAERIREMPGSVRAGSSEEALAAGEVILFAVPGAAVASLIEDHAELLAGKILIDASNNMRGEHRHTLHLMRERVPSARLFRAFNSLGWENFAEPELSGVQADLFYCGDEDGRPVVEQLIKSVGLSPVCLGGTEHVQLVEGMTDMWFALAHRLKLGRRVAFKVLRG